MAGETSGDEFSEENLPPPTGTIFVLATYMLVLAVGWAVMFWMLVDR
jgi:cytochrome c oxidase subunit 2